MDVPGFKTFKVSSLGRVFVKERQWICGNGAIRHDCEHELKYSWSWSHGVKTYKRVVLCEDNKKLYIPVHRLVALCFIPNPENKSQVDHIDRNPLNNEVSNLRWVTAQENNNNRGGKYGRN